MIDKFCVRCQQPAGKRWGLIAGNILCEKCQGEWALLFDKFLLDGAKAAHEGVT